MGRLANTVALISGGARGMGASHARGLVAEGAKVLIGDIRVDEGEAVAEELGAAARFVKLDVTQEHDWEAAVAATEAFAGPLNLLVNNAAIFTPTPIAAVAQELFDQVMHINVLGVFLGMKHAIPSLKRAGGGAIINIGSVAGMTAFPNGGAYLASKWAVRGITKSAALELARDRIRVVAIHPGWFRTPLTEGLPDELTAVNTQAVPRFGEPEEVTKLVLFLASDAAYCTGSDFVIDGGVLLGRLPPPDAG
jgi:3alpha(or 20beta)-hydroxysteroid dehydrogenase